ncbi:hypothetical protein DLAC_05587 [Tieghemostelium lacteum]|uniref:Transmembrane protein n=1 Tax=Tieghemostelium lacteum TaxID=361077 RepID=A0A151ZGJ4_TIELA|nr:hypothetical protein DLAC_05587 [Tieghemostelium lacteum]|eukprot:KYQ92984.1 hypothetical protein DLAC_05587 [Tieghemostelium lacteum]
MTLSENNDFNPVNFDNRLKDLNIQDINYTSPDHYYQCHQNDDDDQLTQLSLKFKSLSTRDTTQNQLDSIDYDNNNNQIYSDKVISKLNSFRKYTVNERYEYALYIDPSLKKQNLIIRLVNILFILVFMVMLLISMYYLHLDVIENVNLELQKMKLQESEKSTQIYIFQYLIILFFKLINCTTSP